MYENIEISSGFANFHGRNEKQKVFVHILKVAAEFPIILFPYCVATKKEKNLPCSLTTLLLSNIKGYNPEYGKNVWIQTWSRRTMA